MSATWIAYGFLGLSIALEVVGTTFLQQSQQFTRFWPSAGVVLCYGLAFYCLSHVLKVLPVGVAYAIWSGLGIVLISTIGYVLFRQRLDAPALFGIGLIIAGVLVINLFSKTVTH